MLELLYAIAIVNAVGLVAALFLWPDHGLFWRWRRTKQRSGRALGEDALKHIHRSERYNRRADQTTVASILGLSAAESSQLIHKLEGSGLLQITDGDLRLTEAGRDYALQVIRAHRLWERYLADETGFDEEIWHEQADLAEHALSPGEIDSLAAELGNPTHDPHGDPIPTAKGDMVPHGGQPLTAMPLNAPLRIVHLEDEPESFYSQLMVAKIYPGMPITLLSATPQEIRFLAPGREHALAPDVAANISVIPWPEAQFEVNGGIGRLSDLALGEKGQVVRISRVCRGSERRRFMDLGILRGTVISAEIVSPSGDPTAYAIREALIALRKEQADLIEIRKMN